MFGSLDAEGVPESGDDPCSKFEWLSAPVELETAGVTAARGAAP